MLGKSQPRSTKIVSFIRYSSRSTVAVRLKDKMVAETFLDKDLGFTIKDNLLIGNNSDEPETGDISELVLDSLSRYPNFIAQIDVQSGEKTTFAEIRDSSIRCALWLKKQGVTKNDVICVSTPNQQNDYIPCLATFYVNAIYNPWYHDLTTENTRRFFEMCRPKIMYTSEQSVDFLAQIAKHMEINCQFVVYGSHAKYLSLKDLMSEQTQSDVDNFKHIKPEDLKNQVGVIYFSSGTTGTPKGTLLSYDTIVNNRMEGCALRSGLNCLWYSSLSWITGTNLVTTCIRLRCTRILHKEFDPEETSKVVEKYKVNWAFWTPTMLTQCYKDNLFSRYNYASVESILIGGSIISKTIMEECQRLIPHTFIINSFGMTEVGGLTVQQTKNRQRLDSIGFVYKGVTLKIMDLNKGHALGPNQCGEICFKLDNIMLGYLNNPEETRKMIDDEGWLHSGDLGYYDENGEVTIVDRIKEVIITQNHHVSPSEIEEILLQHPGVADCVVVSVPHEIDVERPFAFVVKATGSKVTAEELIDLPVRRDEHYRLTGGVIFLDSLLYTSTGKKSRKQLKEMAKTYAK